MMPLAFFYGGERNVWSLVDSKTANIITIAKFAIMRCSPNAKLQQEPFHVTLGQVSKVILKKKISFTEGFMFHLCFTYFYTHQNGSNS